MITKQYYRDIPITIDESDGVVLIETKLLGIKLLSGSNYLSEKNRALIAIYCAIDALLDD